MYDSPNNYYHNDNYTAPSQNRSCRPFNGQGGIQQFRGFTQRNRGQRPQYNQSQFQNYQFRRGAFQQNHTQYSNSCKPYFQGNQANSFRDQSSCRVLNNLEDVVMVGPIIRVAMEHISISITCMTHRQSSMAHLVVYVVVSIIPPSNAMKVIMT